MHTQLHTLTHVAPARGAAPRTVTSVQRPERLLADARDAEVAEELAVARPSSPPPTANVRRAFCAAEGGEERVAALAWLASGPASSCRREK